MILEDQGLAWCRVRLYFLPVLISFGFEKNWSDGAKMTHFDMFF
jgi:hypothetical protein